MAANSGCKLTCKNTPQPTLRLKNEKQKALARAAEIWGSKSAQLLVTPVAMNEMTETAEEEQKRAEEKENRRKDLERQVNERTFEFGNLGTIRSRSAERGTHDHSAKHKRNLEAFEYALHCVFFPLIYDGTQPSSSSSNEVIAKFGKILGHAIDLVTFWDSNRKAKRHSSESEQKPLQPECIAAIRSNFSIKLAEITADQTVLPEFKKALHAFVNEYIKTDKIAVSDVRNAYSATFSQYLFLIAPTVAPNKLDVMKTRFADILNEIMDHSKEIEAYHMLKSAFEIPDQEAREILVRVKAACSSADYVLSQLEQRKKTLENNPFYNADAFSTRKEYDEWKILEQESLNSLMQSIKSSHVVMPASPSPKSRRGFFSLFQRRCHNTCRQGHKKIGKLYIKICKAEGLSMADSKTMSSDPYATVKWGRKKKDDVRLIHTTAVVDRNLSPVWDEEVIIDISSHYLSDIDKEDHTPILRIMVWDKDLVTKDDFLGEVDFTLAELVAGDDARHLRTEWHTLRPRFGKTKPSPKGRLLIERMFVPFPELTSLKSDSAGPSATPPLVDFTRLCKRLFKRLVVYENRLEEASTPVGELAPPSRRAARILTEFALRYGVLDVYTSLLHLELFARHMSMTPEHLEMFLSVLAKCGELSGRGQPSDDSANPVPFTKREKEWFEAIVQRLSEFVKARLSNYKMAFPMNTPQGAVRCLVRALLWLQAYCPEAVRAVLTKDEAASLSGTSRYELAALFVRTAVDAAYNRAVMFQTAAAESAADAAAKPLSGPKAPSKKLASAEDDVMPAVAIAGVLSTVKDELSDDVDAFADEFPEDMGFVGIVARQYSANVTADIEAFFQRANKAGVSQSEVFAVYLKVHQLFEFIDKVCDEAVPEPGFVGRLMSPYIDGWLFTLADKLRTWMDGAVRIDTWQPVDADADPAILHSSSALDLFSACYSAFDFANGLKWHFPEPSSPNDPMSTATLYERLATTVAGVVGRYANLVWQTAYDQDLPKAEPASRGKFLDKSNQQPFVINERLCVRLNNIETCRKLLDEFVMTIEGYGGDDEDAAKVLPENFSERINNATRNTFRDLSALLGDASYNVTRCLDPYFERELDRIIHARGHRRGFSTKDEKREQTKEELKELKEKVSTLLDYLDGNLEVLHRTLYGKVFQRLLLELWRTVVKNFEEMILPSSAKEALAPEQVKAMGLMLRPFADFFHADGAGLREAIIDADVQLFQFALDHYYDPTNTLISMLHDRRERLEAAKKGSAPKEIDPRRESVDAHSTEESNSQESVQSLSKQVDYLVRLLALRAHKDRDASKVVAEAKAEARTEAASKAEDLVKYVHTSSGSLAATKKDALQEAVARAENLLKLATAKK